MIVFGHFSRGLMRAKVPRCQGAKPLSLSIHYYGVLDKVIGAAWTWEGKSGIRV